MKRGRTVRHQIISSAFEWLCRASERLKEETVAEWWTWLTPGDESQQSFCPGLISLPPLRDDLTSGQTLLGGSFLGGARGRIEETFCDGAQSIGTAEREHLKDAPRGRGGTHRRDGEGRENKGARGGGEGPKESTWWSFVLHRLCLSSLYFFLYILYVFFYQQRNAWASREKAKWVHECEWNRVRNKS